MFEKEFSILKRKMSGKRLAYLDSAATTQKPREVIEAISDFYTRHNANVRRAVYDLSLEATKLYEETRDKVQKFINAEYREEIVFTSGATEAINLAVWTWGHENIRHGDEILLTEMEHHSNLVPWQILAKKKGAKLKFIPVVVPATSPPAPPQAWGGWPRTKSRGRERSNRVYQLNLSNLDKLITKKTKIVALTHISNVLGTINPVETITKAAHKKGVLVLVDGAQAGAHIKIDVRKLGCDFYALSGHKMYGPTGVGVLYGRKELLEKMPPYQTGGGMIKDVGFERSFWAELPDKFEAGTPNISAVIGLGAAINFIDKIGRRTIHSRESKITRYALLELKKIPGLIIYGPQNIRDRIGVVSFNVEGVPAHDLADILNEEGVAIRVGHHCAMPLHRQLGIGSSARISFGIHNNKSDIATLIKAVKKAIKIFN